MLSLGVSDDVTGIALAKLAMFTRCLATFSYVATFGAVATFIGPGFGAVALVYAVVQHLYVLFYSNQRDQDLTLRILITVFNLVYAPRIPPRPSEAGEGCLLKGWLVG